MILVLTMLRCPEAVPPETRQVAGGEFSIGRGAENDWVLADPDRHLSKRHCVLAFRSGGWQLADTSTNGTFLNREAEPVGQGRPRPLRDGDRLHLGAYEIEVRVVEAAAPSRGRASPFANDDPFGDDPFAPPATPFASEPPHERMAGSEPVQLPSDFDPLSPDAGEDGLDFPTQPDHSPGLEDAFRPPSGPAPLLPDDWDLDLGSTPAARRPMPPSVQPVREPPVPRPPPRPRPPEPAVRVPEELPPAPDLPPPSAAPPSAAPAFEPEDIVPPPAPPLRAPRPPPQPTAAEGSLLDGFLRGAGIPEAKLADPGATFEELGRAFRVLVGGLRDALIARAAIKGEFRIEQTMIRSSGNNPLKFSADTDDALSALLGTGRRVAMPPSAAIADALRDMRLHELATMSAMQAAVRSLLAELDPQPLRHEAEQGGLALVAVQKKARAWDAFEKLHARIGKALADDFDSIFGKAFARAYEQALDEVRQREGQRT